MSDQNQTGIAGNTTNQQQTATTAREQNIAQRNVFAFKVGIGIIIVILTILLVPIANELSFFWKLGIGGAILFISGKFGNMKDHKEKLWVWPTVLQMIGWSIILVTLIHSGIGEWTQETVNNIDVSTSCAANPEQDRCKAAEAKALEEARKQQEAKYAPKAPTIIQQPDTFPLVQPCMGDIAQQKNCERVTFRGDTYIKNGTKGMCIARNPESLVKETPLGKGTYEYSASKGVTAHFFELFPGETYENASCGKK